ncbi:MAG: M24 family metallopeptidase C-terminal domain-containing protein, partial [Paeniclostridium sordellii]|nr:M24 family metallopeptidase C-terminal domain-containing protein [Paeniclostridium sordellii]
ILARRPMWNIGLDYKCGTGHGVGFLGTIHESPNGFRWRINPQRLETATLEEGMVTTNEPGIYIEGSHGIRIENELITKKAEKNEYGQFMEFEVVTFAPIDIDAIDVNDLNREEREYLNNYHKLVYKKISPYLEEDEVQWLKNYTKEI